MNLKHCGSHDWAVLLESIDLGMNYYEYTLRVASYDSIKAMTQEQYDYIYKHISNNLGQRS